MNPNVAHWNLAAAWLGILLGFVWGMLLGMHFHREQWLGGYASYKRRLYRLGHIALFGLGAINLMFWLTARNVTVSQVNLAWASALFVIGAVTMPVCCVIMAHWPKLRMLFAVPVISLIAAAVLTLTFVLQDSRTVVLNSQLSTLNPL